MPKVSIIIPVFNCAQYLQRCVKSCTEQTLRDIEIILVDDKSEDNSLQIAQDLARNDERIRIIPHARNLGTFLARKRGVDSANGEFLLFLDADDFLSPNALEILHRSALENGADMVHCKIVPLPSKKFASKPKIQTQILRNDEILRQIFVRDFKKGYLVIYGKLLATKLIRRALDKLKFINCHLVASEDTALFLPICALAKKSVGVNEASYFYTQNPASLLKSTKSEKILIQIENRQFLKENMSRLLTDSELSHNPYFRQSLQNTLDLMDYFICYSKRFLPASTQDSAPYIKYSVLSFKYVARWQIAVKLAIFLLSFGRKKL